MEARSRFDRIFRSSTMEILSVSFAIDIAKKLTFIDTMVSSLMNVFQIQFCISFVLSLSIMQISVRLCWQFNHAYSVELRTRERD